METRVRASTKIEFARDFMPELAGAGGYTVLAAAVPGARPAVVAVVPPRAPDPPGERRAARPRALRATRIWLVAGLAIMALAGGGAGALLAPRQAPPPPAALRTVAAALPPAVPDPPPRMPVAARLSGGASADAHAHAHGPRARVPDVTGPPAAPRD